MQVFISHGHNEIVRYKLEQFVRTRLGLDPLVLQAAPDLGMTIVEKLEHYGSGCSFALIVLTADDVTAEGGRRARQNVLHELGFFHGKLGRRRVLLLRQHGVELFSNISGLIYKDFDADRVESAFEAIRMAIESGNAVPFAQVMGPDTRSAELAQLFERLWTDDMPPSSRIELIQRLTYGQPEDSRRYLEKILASTDHCARAEIDAAALALADIDDGKPCKNLGDRVEAREWETDEKGGIGLAIIAKALYWNRPNEEVHKTAAEVFTKFLAENPPPPPDG